MSLWINYIDQIFLFAALALSLNLLLGYAGQVSVAHAAFGAIGGYTMAYTTQAHGWNFLLGTLLGMVLAFVIGTLVALPALKLSVEYLILLTLAVSSVILGLLVAIPEMGGTYGLINLPAANLFGWTLRRPEDWLIPSFVAMAIVYAICFRVGESPVGRVLKGIREDPVATQALGKNVFGYKVTVFGMTSALAAFAGAMLAAWFRLSTPGVFGFSFSLTVFAIVIFGGMGNLNGTILGAAVVVLLEPVLERVINIDPAKAGYWQLIVYGVLLAVLMRVRPQGALPEGFSLWRWLTGQRRREGARRDGPRLGAPDGAQRRRARRRASCRSSRRTGASGRGTRRRSCCETSNVSKRFGGIVAADELAIELRKGTITALVGPNGAGKTTVFNLLTGAIPPDSGSIMLNGEELIGLDPHRVARKGMVRSFQDVRLFNRLSCLQNVMMAVQEQPGENFATLGFRHGKVKRAEAETPDEGDGLAGLRRHGRVRRRPGRRPVLRPDEADLARPRAGDGGRRAAARRAGVGHRHEVGRHDARPHRAGPRPGPHGLRRRAQPARRRPPRRPHVLHGARPDHGPGHDRRAHQHAATGGGLLWNR